MAKIRNIERKFVSGLGFSKGWAALALRDPPPLVPSCLIASWEANGPRAMTCVPPSRVVTSWYGASVWIIPWETKTRVTIMQIGSST